MNTGWESDAYNAYINRLANVSRIPVVNSIEEANAGWGLRRLSASDFEHLEAHSKEDRDLNERWLNRMRIGYDREKSQIAIEIEDIFSDVPCITEPDSRGEVHAA